MKIGEFVAAFPSSAAPLEELAPTLRKIRESGHWKTVAKLITVSQAARLAGLPFEELLARLQQSSGNPELTAARPATEAASDEVPAWVAAEPSVTLDADALLEAGVHPMAKTRELLRGLQQDAVVALTSTFPPVPLIEGLRRRGFEVCSLSSAQAGYVTLIRNRGGEA